MTMTELVHPVTCIGCGGEYDAMAASWCQCISKEPSFVCPHCGSCFCSARAAYKTQFWGHAPSELWIRRRQYVKSGARLFSNPAPHEVRRPLVLIVDDDPVLRHILVAQIHSQGYGAITAADGSEGLHLADLYRPQLVITDALMPQLDGREMARQIRRTAPATRIVVMTSVYKTAQQKYEALRDFGADEYLSKPVAVEKLLEVLKRQLSSRR